MRSGSFTETSDVPKTVPELFEYTSWAQQKLFWKLVQLLWLFFLFCFVKYSNTYFKYSLKKKNSLSVPTQKTFTSSEFTFIVNEWDDIAREVSDFVDYRNNTIMIICYYYFYYYYAFFYLTSQFTELTNAMLSFSALIDKKNVNIRLFNCTKE